MEELEALWFVRVRSTPQTLFAAGLSSEGLSLPEDYLDFLNFVAPARINLGFRFCHADSHEEWEGQVSEFVDYSTRPQLLADAVIQLGELRLLPIAADAGGNFVYLNLRPGNHAVVDQDYRTGTLSVIANSFSEFVRLLYVAE